MRFADLIREHGIDTEASFADQRTNRYEAQYIEDQLAATPVVFDVTAVAQAVADGMAVQPDPPAMRPPLDTLWAEYVVPGHADGIERVGALVRTWPWEERWKRPAITRTEWVSYEPNPKDTLMVARMQAMLAAQEKPAQTPRELQRKLRALNRLRDEHLAAVEDARTRAEDLSAEIDAHNADKAAMDRLEASLTVEPTWFVSMHGYARISGRNVTGFGRWHWALDERGDPIGSAHVFEAHTTRFLTIALAMSLTNCGNVDTDEHHPEAKLQRARERRNKPPLVSYRTLVIRPMSRSGGAGPVDRSDAATRLHLRRGGFRDYRANGLFGRDYLRRVFWFSPTLVGREEHGAVVKDYEVAGK